MKFMSIIFCVILFWIFVLCSSLYSASQAQSLESTILIYSPPLYDEYGINKYKLAYPSVHGFGVKNPNLDYPAGCYNNKKMYLLNHAGEDWWKTDPPGTTYRSPVKTIADGIVKWYDNVYYPGNVMLIEHNDFYSGTIYSMYGHIDKLDTIEVGHRVRRGQQIGTVFDQEAGNNSHLHWEVREFFDPASVGLCNTRTENAGPGYVDEDENPYDYGYFHPSNTINREVSSGPIVEEEPPHDTYEPNDSFDTAHLLRNDGAVSYISQRGDIDWYQKSISAIQPYNGHIKKVRLLFRGIRVNGASYTIQIFRPGEVSSFKTKHTGDENVTEIVFYVQEHTEGVYRIRINSFGDLAVNTEKSYAFFMYFSEEPLPFIQ